MRLGTLCLCLRLCTPGGELEHLIGKPPGYLSGGRAAIATFTSRSALVQYRIWGGQHLLCGVRLLWLGCAWLLFRPKASQSVLLARLLGRSGV